MMDRIRTPRSIPTRSSAWISFPEAVAARVSGILRTGPRLSSTVSPESVAINSWLPYMHVELTTASGRLHWSYRSENRLATIFMTPCREDANHRFPS